MHAVKTHGEDWGLIQPHWPPLWVSQRVPEQNHCHKCVTPEQRGTLEGFCILRTLQDIGDGDV